MINHKIEVVPYNPDWPALFQSEASRIQASGLPIVAIHHIGSTAIPGMPAKPVIDILLELSSLDDIELIARKMRDLNYDDLRRSIIPHQSYFTLREDEIIRYHVHIYSVGDPQIHRHINFRDYVIQHHEDAHAYAELKRKLASQFADDRYRYTLGKDKLIQEIGTKAKLWQGKCRNYLPAYRGPCRDKWSQEKIMYAMESNLNIHMTYFAQYLNQVEFVRIPGVTLVNSGLADDTFNYVLDADFTDEEVNKKIADVTEHFRQRHIPFSWWVSPHDKPGNLVQYLEKAGFQNTEKNVAMYFDLDAWTGDVTEKPELKIVRATDKKALRDFALVLANDAAAFETYYAWIASILTVDDPIEYYVGYVDGVPVVRGLVCYYAGVAGMYWLSTTPQARRKGYGTAMQQFRLQRAKELGYHLAVLQASDEGFPLYQRLGYKECGIFREYKLIQKIK